MCPRERDGVPRPENDTMTAAAENYRTRLAQVRTLIERLQRQLVIHERRQSARPLDRGFAGDLQHIAERLRDLIPRHTDRRCEWKIPKTCGEYAAYCTPDGRLVCHDHAPEAGFDPSECLDVETGLPADED
jgi:hypothetical protein